MSLHSLRTSVESLANKFNNKLEAQVVKPLGTWLDKRETIKTVDMVSKHIFRAVQMYAFSAVLPFSPITNQAIGALGGISYRLTIEGQCPYHFAIVSCIGGFAIERSLPALITIIQGKAFHSLLIFRMTLLGLTPISLYLLSIIWISHAAIQLALKNKQQKPEGSCCGAASNI